MTDSETSPALFMTNMLPFYSIARPCVPEEKAYSVLGRMRGSFVRLCPATERAQNANPPAFAPAPDFPAFSVMPLQ
jgi:hypothetical protein